VYLKMAKSLKNYKRKSIACVIVEDFESGNVYKVVDEENIKNGIEKYTENEITYIYNPTQEQRSEILGIFEKKEDDGKIKSTMKEIDMLTKVIPMLTDIEVNLDNEEDLEIVRDNIQDPDKVFSKVVMELNSILMDINLEWVESLKMLHKVPSEIMDIISMTPQEN